MVDVARAGIDFGAARQYGVHQRWLVGEFAWWCSRMRWAMRASLSSMICASTASGIG
jgi:hypothetical protein